MLGAKVSVVESARDVAGRRARGESERRGERLDVRAEIGVDVGRARHRARVAMTTTTNARGGGGRASPAGRVSRVDARADSMSPKTGGGWLKNVCVCDV